MRSFRHSKFQDAASDGRAAKSCNWDVDGRIDATLRRASFRGLRRLHFHFKKTSCSDWICERPSTVWTSTCHHQTTGCVHPPAPSAGSFSRSILDVKGDHRHSQQTRQRQHYPATSAFQWTCCQAPLPWTDSPGAQSAESVAMDTAEAEMDIWPVVQGDVHR